MNVVVNVLAAGWFVEFVHWYFSVDIPDWVSVTVTFVLCVFWYVSFPFVSNVTVGFSLSTFIISISSVSFSFTVSFTLAFIVPFVLYVNSRFSSVL